MYVSRYMIEMAVLRVFRDYRVFRAGASLWMRDLQEAWTKTGLRDRDLVSGIDFLSESQCVRVEPYPPSGEVLVTLLAQGES